MEEGLVKISRPMEESPALRAGVQPNPDLKPVNLSIGEPQHATPRLVLDALVGEREKINLVGFSFGGAMAALSAAATGCVAKNFEPRVVGWPAQSAISCFTTNGTPLNGPSEAGGASS